MDDLKLFKYFMCGGLPLFFALLFFVVLVSSSSSGGSDSVAVAVNTSKFCPPLAQTNYCEPFSSQRIYSVTSPYGWRLDPLGSGKNLLHTGIDLGAPAGTPVLASADGIVYEVGYSPTGLGNYVYIKHETELGTLYTAYGHMLDNSIIVEKDQPITAGQQVGSVGSTGASTGNHLHFMIMKGKVSFKEADLIDPHFIIYGLN